MIWFLLFNLFVWYIILIYSWYIIDWFANIEHLCMPGKYPTWVWCMTFLMYCWIWFATVLLRIFVSLFISNIGLFFFFISLPTFSIRVIITSQIEFGSIISSAIFWNSLRRIGVNSSLEAEIHCEAIWSWTFCWEFCCCCCYWLDFTPDNWSVHILYFFLIMSWEIVHF